MKKLVLAAAVAAVVHMPLHAQAIDATIGGMDLTVGGFGTYGVVVTDTNTAQFVRNAQPYGASEHPSDKVDSNLGVQATLKVNSWLSATVQVLAEEREGYSSGFSADTAWAYIKLDPTDNLSIKLGRVEMPLFAISDSRDINYANAWIRPPNEVYALANIEELNGIQATYTQPIGPTHLSVTGFAGNTVIYLPTIQYNAWDVHGGEVRWDIADWVTLRAGIATTIVDVNIVPTTDKYTFQGYGLLVDHDNVVFQAESVRRYDASYAFVSDSSGWYVFGGYRFGKILPYASFASTVKSKPYIVPVSISYDQDTEAVGVRWDAFSAADIKFQAERVHLKGTRGISFVDAEPGFGAKSVDVFSLAIDFVF